MPTRRVTVERNRLRFAASHMATFGGTCEPLHGHNYDVFVEVEGDLTKDGWVWDFGDLKRTTLGIIEQLDHRFLLQRRSTLLAIEERPTNWAIRFGEKGYVFPKEDVVALPVENTTSEQIAEWISGELAAALRAKGALSMRKLTVGIEEMPGQAGWYTVDL
ncbi:MAG: 6-pyruvoyl tetrahydropterin synthase family protein [Dehalococcoidia bacterium]|nr:6-pyruvoyl tetrahydropterin synthase family protein [Dehalococcoidia bacterium]